MLLDKQGDSGEFEHSNGDDSDDDGLRVSPDDSANEDFLNPPASPAPRPTTPLHFDMEAWI